MQLMKRTKEMEKSRLSTINVIVWMIVACLVLAFPLAGCGSSSQNDLESILSDTSSSSSGSGLSDKPGDYAGSSPSQSPGASSAEGSAGSSLGSGAQGGERITPSVKAAADEYERAVDAYCEFMKRYIDSGYSSSMMSDYTKLTKQYEEASRKFSTMKSSSFTDADFEYVIEVSERMSQKLAELFS